MKSEELCQNIDDIYYEETEEFDTNDVDDDLYDAPSNTLCCEAKDVTCEQDTNNIFLLHNNLHEKRYKKILEHTIYGFKEVSLSFSLHNINRILSVRVDCLTKKHAVEFDFANKWHESIGQALHYGLMTGKKPMVVLILDNPEKQMVYYYRVKKLAKKYKFDVEYVTDDILHLDKDGKCQNPKCKCHKCN